MRKLLVILFGSLLFPIAASAASHHYLHPLLDLLLQGSEPIISDKPGPTNTGFLTPRHQLTSYNGLVIENDGTVLEGCFVQGTIQVKADNVTIRDCLIETTGFYGIQTNFGATGLLIEDVEIRNMRSAGIFGNNFTVRRANIHDAGGDAIKPGNNVIIKDSWLHRLGYLEDSHSDGVQMVSGSNVIIRGNNIDMPHDLAGFTNSQCMIIQTNNGPIDNILIESNWLNGGGYCVQINDKGNGHGAPTNVRILNNRFGRDYQFGIWRFRDSTPTHSGNRWDDTGELID